MTPGIGAYWLYPSRMYGVTASISSGAQLKSGTPCDRLIAPCSSASRDIFVKIVTPVPGSLERTGMVLRMRGIRYQVSGLRYQVSVVVQGTGYRLQAVRYSMNSGALNARTEYLLRSVTTRSR